MFMSKRINPNTKHKTKSNSLNKFESEQANTKKKKERKKTDLTQADRWGGQRATVEMHAVEAHASLSL